MKCTFIFFLLGSIFYLVPASSQIDSRLFQYPDVSEHQIVFAFGGDIWIVPKTGGVANKLSNPKGSETFPRFSPDGSQVAFSGNYDGNTDIYVMPSDGGIPVRITHHEMTDRLLDWYPDGESLLYASSRESGKQRFSQFYKVPASGGLPEKLPVAYGEFASISPNGSKIAFTDRSRVFRTWKRYRGGTAADVWIFDLKTLESENITDNIANDELPMWIGNKIYFISDQGTSQRFNIWSYDINSKKSKQITDFTDFDVHFPANNDKEIVYEAGGKIYLLDLKSEKSKEVNIQISSDLISIKPRMESVERYVQNADISPDGNRVLIQARGELFSVPAEKGVVRNLSRSPGVAERTPAWSPNGKYIAYWSDKSGEYELTIRDLTKGGEEKQLTTLGPGFRYQLYWSPDSKKMSFVDQTMTIWVYDLDSNTTNRVDQDISLYEGGLRNWRPNWSSDSQWLVYSKTLENGNGAIFFYNTQEKTTKQATSGFYSDLGPCFDPEGKYLYLVTNRSFDPVYSDFDNTWTYPNATQLAVIPLRKDVQSPLHAENDTVKVEEEKEMDEKKEEEKEEEGEAENESEDEGEDEGGEEKDKDGEGDKEEVKIDFEGFERRIVILPPKAGNMGGLSAVEGKVIFQRWPNSGSGENGMTLKYFDLKEREEKDIISGINGYQLSADGKKLLVRKGSNLAVIDMKAGQKFEKQLALNEMKMTIDPRKEWAQIFNDSWRFQRDFFYDEGMHGVNWELMKNRYGELIQYAMNREDVNFIIGELIGELNASHTYRGGGDQENPERVAVGYLGVDWAQEGGHYKVDKIIRGAEWDNEVRSPLEEPGVNISEGDFMLAVNGVPLNEYPDPWGAFTGLAEKTVELTVNSVPFWENARTEIVKTLDDETRLRNLAWIEQNRKRVDEASGGTIGYIYVPSTGRDGQKELARQFYAQWNKKGLIIDERFNNGGQIPDRFIELLNRKPLAYWDVRDGQNWQWPPVAHFGSMAMLTNGWAGSGGDAFPDYFRKAGLGPLIGGRTWGGLIGISGAPSLIDGGVVTVPTFRMYNPDGTWFREGHGVDPDIKVREDPTALAKGTDTQLERAISEVQKLIEKKGPIHPKTPPREDRNQVIKP